MLKTPYILYIVGLICAWMTSLYIIDYVDKSRSIDAETFGALGLCWLVTLASDTFGIHRRVWSDTWRPHRRVACLTVVMTISLSVLVFAATKVQSEAFTAVSGLVVWLAIFNAIAALTVPVRLLASRS